MAFKWFWQREDTAERVGDQQAESNILTADLLLSSIMNGEKITKRQALSIPAVAGNVDFISSLIASMPVKLYKYKQDKIVEVTDDTRTELLNNSTNDTLNGYDFKKALVEDYLLDKGGYAYINKYRNEKPAFPMLT